MGKTKWNDFNSVNIKELDDHHKQMAKMLEKLSKNKDQKKLGHIIEKLIAYAHYHFQAEEKYFKKYQYPEGPEHASQHQRFLKTIKDFERKHKANKLDPVEFLDFLSSWWINHVNDADHKYSTFLNKRGVY